MGGRGLFALIAYGLTACTFDWDAFDPREREVNTGGAGGEAVGGSGGSGGLTEGECGDGVINTGEQCDDAGTATGDGCDAGCEVECSGLFNAELARCYVYIVGGFTEWAAARSECEKLGPGYDLAAISSGAEHDWLASQSIIATQLVESENDSVIWLGGTDTATEGTWVWSNGEPFLELWVEGEPNNGGNEDCVVLCRRDGFVGYDDRGCIDDPFPALCELTPAGS